MFQIGPTLDYFMPQGERLPSRKMFNSPLKKRKDITQTAMNAVVQSDLNPPKKQKLNDGQSVRKRTVSDYLDYINQLSSEFQSQVWGIEHCLEISSLSLDQKFMIRDKMIHILNSLLSVEGKLGELGILYYYLASEKTIPTEPDHSLLNLRLEAIEREALELKQLHKRSLEGRSADLLPSGRTNYFLLTFARMIFPPNGGFNLGGCYALKALLNTRLNLLLTEEMRYQILSVVDCLLKDPEFLQLFLDPFKVHSLMEHMILLDLKIPLDEEMNFVYVRWSMLIALLSSMGQCGEGNCYAVAPIMNLLNGDKKALVRLMIEIFSTGHFSFGGKGIPILLLMETRRSYAKDFRVEMTREQVQELTPLNVARFVLKKSETPSLEKENVRRSLGEWIDSEFMEEAKAARESVLAHKLSFPQQALLAAIQFAEQNSLQVSKKLSGWRLRIVKEMSEHVNTSLNKRMEYSSVKNDPDFKKFKTEVFRHILSSLFLVDYSHTEYTVENGKVVFDFHTQGFKFNGNLKDYRPFQELRRLFRLSEGEFTPIDKLSDFIDYCVKSLDIVSPDEVKASVKIGQRLLKQHFANCLFRENMAKQLSLTNQCHSDLSWQNYDESDSFYLIQRGGRGWVIDDLEALEGKFSCHETLSSQDARDFFVNLCDWSFNNFDGVLTDDYHSDPLVLASYNGHVFNLTPFHFSSYWKSDDYLNELNKRVILPGKNLGQKALSKEQMLRALRYVDGLMIDEEFVDDCIEKDEISVKAFYEKVIEKLEEEDHIEFNEALTDVIREFSFESLEENFSFILFSLGIELSFEEYQEVIKYVERSKKSKLLLNPFISAVLIQKALMRCSRSLPIPVRTLEAAICQCFKLPEFVELANLNWVKELSEQLGYKYMGITFDVLTQSLVLCKKRGDFISVFENEKAALIYETFTVHSNASD